ncbi:hypothetical protein ACMD2_01461 [Ananas comosus]|uniref:Uncharacterized protein n=1 Tax=Ananas comosus TaxID=4615 RepID=A0A199VB83_ANACO|nr:hypothetical protein ACMD2_01461 [Ananas comosus]
MVGEAEALVGSFCAAAGGGAAPTQKNTRGAGAGAGCASASPSCTLSLGLPFFFFAVVFFSCRTDPEGQSGPSGWFEMDVLTQPFKIINLSLLLRGGLGDLGASGILLLDTLDHSDSNGLPHVTDGKTAKGRVLGEGLNNHGLGRNHLNKARITVLQELGLLLELLARAAINLGEDLSKLNSDVGGVAVEYGSIAIANLSGVVHDDNLRSEASGLLCRIFLRVGGDETTFEILDGDVLNVEANGLVVHLHRLDLSGQPSGPKGDHHTGLEDTGFNTTHRDSADTTNLVDVLKGKAERLVGGPLWLLNQVEGLKKGRALVPVEVG